MQIKLSDYCKKKGISYITGYRWFKEGKLPVKSEQTESGTILVEDVEDDIIANNSETISIVLKKVIELKSKDDSLENFASWILANFYLKYNGDNCNDK